MNCEKCQDVGFTEENNGLLMIACDCEKAREVAEGLGIPWSEEAKNDSNSGTGQANNTLGSKDTGKHKQPAKSKARAKSGKNSK